MCSVFDHPSRGVGCKLLKALGCFRVMAEPKVCRLRALWTTSYGFGVIVLPPLKLQVGVVRRGGV